MLQTRLYSAATISRDLTAGLVVFLVALPLCLGVALASGAPLFSGLLAGIVGGILVGVVSGSHTSVSGPAAGLTAIVATQIALLGSFETFLLAVVLAGLIQISLGVARAGFIAAFFPSSVIKGLLAAIGVILILKQIPHVLGHDTDPGGEMNFQQPNHQTIFSELSEMLGNLHLGAAVIGISSIVFLVAWARIKPLNKSVVQAPLLVVLMGVAFSLLFKQLGGAWAISASHLVQVPVADSLPAFFAFMRLPDFSQWTNPAIYTSAVTIAIVASLETLLNLEAIDKLDSEQRESPSSRELVAQGMGNVAAGLIGGIPVTSVIVRSSINIHAGARTKLATISHGALILVCVMFLPAYLNLIPLSCLAAILLVTGIELASPALIKRMWDEGRYQFIPFAVTLVSIVLTDLLQGILIGLAVSLSFILHSNLRRPMHRVMEKHLGGEVLRIKLANQVSFLNRAALERTLRSVPRGGNVLLDARHSEYIDPDVLALIRDFKEQIAPAHGVGVSLRGFRTKYQLEDEIQFVDYCTLELQGKLTPAQVLQILRVGNQRFFSGQRLAHDLHRQLHATAQGQHPLAVVLSCIDSRAPAELVFDLGLGDIFNVRIAGNVVCPNVLGSLEYGCGVAGSKLILVMGHTRCGAVIATMELALTARTAEQVTGCKHLDLIVDGIQQSIDLPARLRLNHASGDERAAFIDSLARGNVRHAVRQIVDRSPTVRRLVQEKRVAVIGAMYDVGTGRTDFLCDTAVGLDVDPSFADENAAPLRNVGHEASNLRNDVPMSETNYNQVQAS